MFSPTFLLIYASVVFFGTYILIASEKVHKTPAALLGGMLMLLLMLAGKYDRPDRTYLAKEG